MGILGCYKCLLSLLPLYEHQGHQRWSFSTPSDKQFSPSSREIFLHCTCSSQQVAPSPLPTPLAGTPWVLCCPATSRILAFHDLPPQGLALLVLAHSWKFSHGQLADPSASRMLCWVFHGFGVCSGSCFSLLPLLHQWASFHSSYSLRLWTTAIFLTSAPKALRLTLRSILDIHSLSWWSEPG